MHAYAQAEVFIIRLLQRDASVTTAGPDRNTPLHLAAIKGFVNVGRKLIESGAFVAAENKDRESPLSLAVLNEHCEFAVLMVRNMEAARYTCMHIYKAIIIILCMEPENIHELTI